MTDALIDLSKDGGDLVLEGGDLVRDEGLETAVIVSILSDARASAGASPTALEPETRGWWADSIRDRFGSRLWTLERSKRTSDTLERAKEIAKEALAWLLEERIAERIEIVPTYDEFGALRLDVEIFRGSAPHHAELWAGTGAVRVHVAQDVPFVPTTPSEDQNVVMMLFDDGGLEKFNWSGLLTPSDGHALTPRIDEMRARGVTFRRAHATSICGPTRASFQTGRYCFRHGLGGNLDGAGATGYRLGVYGGVSTELLIARALRLGRDGTADQSLGNAAFTYVSAWFGKLHIASDGGQEDFPVTQGWGRYIGCPPNAASLENWPVGQEEPFTPGDPEYVVPHANSGHFHFREVAHVFGGSITQETFGAPGTWPAGGPYLTWSPSSSPRGAWGPYKIVRDALQWANTRTQPFFMLLCMNPPHSPFETPPYTYPDTVGFGASGATRDLITPATQALMNSLNGGAGGPGFRPLDPARLRQVYLANIQAIDTLVGLLYDRLDPEKRDKTVFIWMGDNGTVSEAVSAPYNPTHSKRTVFEQGTRVPMVVWGSGAVVQGPGRFCDHLVHVTDVFSTILEITGCEPERWNPGGEIKIDGKSFLQALVNPSAPPARDFIYNEIFIPIGGQLDASPAGVPPIVETQWFRTFSNGTHKLFDQPLGASPPYKLFKIDSGPGFASGQPGYLELPEDDLYPLAIDGMHPETTATFQALLDGMNEILES